MPSAGSVRRAAAVGATVSVAYLRFVRPWQLGWGATEDERGRPLPGDDLVERPTFAATRAITMRAGPADIWPWLAQVGVNRAGWYSYDLLDNLGRPSARELIPELLDIKVGDLMPMSPDGKHGIRVHALDPPCTMLWGTPGDTSWAWILDARPDGSTRVLTRVRSKYRWLSPTIAFSMLLEFADIWMMRRMLLNLRERVEAVPAPTTDPVPPRRPRADVQVRNVHRRAIGSPEELGALLASLGSDADRLWPGDRWPRMRLDDPLAVGARGGHGPIRYRVEAYDPSQLVRFRFERPRGFDGVHQFAVVSDGEGPAQLTHLLEARMSGIARLSWPLVFRPLHDALIEDALDRAERQVTGRCRRPTGWTTYVRVLRWALTASSRGRGSGRTGA